TPENSCSRGSFFKSVIHRQFRFTLFLLIFCYCTAAAQQGLPVEYKVSLKDAPRHIANVSVTTFAQGRDTDFQLPVWNALYQVRNFAKDVISFSAQDPAGRPLTVHKLDKTTWRVSGYPVVDAPRITVTYKIVLDQPGPFGAQLTTDRAFINPAQVLVYPVGQ